MSTTQRGGGGNGGGRKRDKLKGLANRLRGRRSGSLAPIRIMSPNEHIPTERQSGMIFLARGPHGAKIVILNNGTWNDALRASAPSNVQTHIPRLMNTFLGSTSAQDDGKNPQQRFVGQLQIPVYQPGVGNETEGNFVVRNLSNILGGGLGKGISKNIVYSYIEICIRYQPGDEVFLMGFSRGGFTSLSVDAFIADVGIIKIPGMRIDPVEELPAPFLDPWDQVATHLFKAWLAVKNENPPRPWGAQDYPQIPDLEYEVIRGPPGSLIGGVMVYEPVAAYKFVTTRLAHPITSLERTLQSVPSQIRFLRVAYALNEYRYPYTQIQLRGESNATQRTAIVWWPGDHSTIGGRSTQHLNISENTFLFMTQELQAAGFRLDAESLAAFTATRIGERQVLHNSYSTIHAAAGGRHIREPLQAHHISRMTRLWEEYTLLSEEGIQELLEPVFNPPQAQGNQQQGYFWATKKHGYHVREWTGPLHDGNDGLQIPRQLTSVDELREERGPSTPFGGQAMTVGQAPEHDPNIMGIGPNVPPQSPHTPTRVGSPSGTQHQQQFE